LHKVPFEKRMKLYHEALDLHKMGLGIHKIERELRTRHGYSVAAANISKWIYHGARPDARANIPNLNPSPQLSYFIGAFKGDGFDYYNAKKQIYRVGLRVKDKDFLRRVSRTIAYVVGRSPSKLWTAKGAGGADDVFHTFTVESWSLRRFLRGNLSGLLAVALKFPRDFLRGIFDAEGYVTVTRDRKRLRVHLGIEMSNKMIVKTIQRILARDFGIRATGPYRKKGRPTMLHGHFAMFKRDTYSIHISSQEAVGDFAKNVGFAMKRKRDTLKEALSLLRAGDSKEALRIWEGRHGKREVST